jgi:tRNA threonylcarbamoyladenosine biosynthesis protein TsaE
VTAEGTIRTSTPGETRRVGQRIGRMVRAGDVVLLSGELGAGKTVLAQGIGRGLGVPDPIKSSSFVIMNEYGGRLRLFHADLYRLEDPAQVAELALDELAADGVLVVEWPERAPGELPEEHLSVRIEYDGARARILTIETRGARYEPLAAQLMRRTRGRVSSAGNEPRGR